MYLTIDQIEIGQKAEIKELITKEKVLEFAYCSGDFSPIHIDEDYAKKTRYKRCIAHGMLSAAFISKLLGTYLPGEGTIYLEQSLSFKRPVYYDEELTIIGTVVEKDTEKNICIMEMKCFNQDNKVVVEGMAKVMPPKE